MKRPTDEGASAVEYGLLLAAIAAVIVAVVLAVGVFVQDNYTVTCEALETQLSSPTPCS